VTPPSLVVTRESVCTCACVHKRSNLDYRYL